MGADALPVTSAGIVAATTSNLAVAITVVATLVVVALLVAAVSVMRSARQLRQAAEELAQSTKELIEDVGAAVSRAGVELERVDDLVGSAESITETVGAASRLAYVALSNPLIKVLAVGRGTARASRRLRYARAQSERQRRLTAGPPARPAPGSSQRRGWRPRSGADHRSAARR